MGTFVKPEGHKCFVSSNVFDHITFGTGELDTNGFWEKGCPTCAREWEKQFPKDYPCWPYPEGFLKGGCDNNPTITNPPAKPIETKEPTCEKCGRVYCDHESKY